MRNFILIILLFFSLITYSQVTLDANGPGNTYEEITQVLAAGYDPIEEPDCNHTNFGRHIDEIFDTELNINVFRFFMHISQDNDRCINFDRQRNEIKSYSNSPDNLLGVEGEEVIYKWKFKIDSDFQVSTSFTSVHQLKSVGGSLASMPMYTITLRKGNPDRLELRYAEISNQITLKQSDLTPFKGVWLDVVETITYGISGKYSIQIKKVSDNSILFDYSNNSIVNWRVGTEFVRPKWGIYRSLNSIQDLRDEEVLFANFSIEETNSLSIKNYELNNNSIEIHPNPINNLLIIKEQRNNIYTSFNIYNMLGQKVMTKNNNSKEVDISSLTKGFYTIIFMKNNTKVIEKKLLKK